MSNSVYKYHIWRNLDGCYDRQTSKTLQHVGSCLYAEDAAALVALQGEGSEIRLTNGETVWTEGAEEASASESYDAVAETVYRREELSQGIIHHNARNLYE